jgi:hypothetical protein
VFQAIGNLDSGSYVLRKQALDVLDFQKSTDQLLPIDDAIDKRGLVDEAKVKARAAALNSRSRFLSR